MSISEPSKILTPWAESGLKNPIPSDADPVTGRAGFDQGFPAINMTPKESGGIPPFGQDFNGIFFDITSVLRYMQAGGRPTFSAELAAAIGGYPKGAVVMGDDGVAAFQNSTDSNASNPNSGGSGWVRIDPYALTQQSGSLTPDASWADVPSYSDPNFGSALNAQAEALAARTEQLRENAPTTSEFSDSSSPTEALVLAMTSTKTRGHVLISDAPLTVDGAQIKGSNAPTDVIIEGDASLIGCLRKFSAKKYLPEYHSSNTIDPHRHLSNLSLTASPVVAIIGDSISTLRVNASANDDSMWGMLTAKLQNENPKKTFQFYNRAIGGKTFASTILPVTGEPWSVGGTKKWYEYIVELNPDLVFIAFGMNDSANLNWAAFSECVNAIAATNTRIIFITTPVPSKAAIFTGETNEWNTDAGQEGRDHAACVVRTYAQNAGHGLLDMNRTMVACRDGFDVATSPLKQITSGASGFYEIPDKVIDSSFRFTIAGADWPTIAANAADQPSYLYGGDYADVVIFENNNNTSVTLRAYQTRNSSVGSYLSKNVPVVVPGSTHYFDVSCIGNVVSIYHSTISFNNMTLLLRFNALRGRGYGRARVGSYDTGGSLQNIEAAGGVRHAQYRQIITDTEIWGQSATNANTQPEYGGNGVNHYSSRGLAKIVKKTLDAISFHAPLFERWPASNQSGGVFSRLDDRTLLVRGVASLTAVPIDVPFGAVFMSSPLVLPNFPQSLFKSIAGQGIDGSVSLLALAGGLGVWAGDAAYDSVNGWYTYRLFCPVTRSGVSAKVHYTAVGEINPTYLRVEI